MNKQFVQRDGHMFALLYHYVTSEETAREIAKSAVMIPGERPEDSLTSFVNNPEFTAQRVNFTDVAPEEGRDTISAATGMFTPNVVNWGLELLVPAERLVQRLETHPRCYQIYTPSPIPVTVRRIWNMDKVEHRVSHGYQIVRGHGSSGLAVAYWDRRPIPVSQTMNRSRHNGSPQGYSVSTKRETNDAKGLHQENTPNVYGADQRTTSVPSLTSVFDTMVEYIREHRIDLLTVQVGDNTIEYVATQNRPEAPFEHRYMLTLEDNGNQVTLPAGGENFEVISRQVRDLLEQQMQIGKMNKSNVNRVTSPHLYHDSTTGRLLYHVNPSGLMNDVSAAFYSAPPTDKRSRVPLIVVAKQQESEMSQEYLTLKSKNQST